MFQRLRIFFKVVTHCVWLSFAANPTMQDADIDELFNDVEIKPYDCGVMENRDNESQVGRGRFFKLNLQFASPRLRVQITFSSDYVRRSSRSSTRAARPF